MPALIPGNIGADVTSKHGLFPAAQGAAASFGLHGTAIDRQGIDSFVAQVMVGAVDAGTFTLDGKLQESDDNSTFTDVATNPQNGTVALTQMTTANKIQHIAIDARGLKRYVRMAFTVAFAGGGAALEMSHAFIVGGNTIGPVTQATT